MTMIEEFEQDPLKFIKWFKRIWIIMALMMLAVMPTLQMATALIAGTTSIFTSIWIINDRYNLKLK